MEYESLRDLFVHDLRGAYHMERQLVPILEEMAGNASNERIATGFADHHDETQEHVVRLEEAFRAMDLAPEERACPVVDALDEERRTVEDAVSDPELLDLFYVGAGIKTERVELSTYDSMLTMARRLELGDEVTDPLAANRDSEKSTLTQLETINEASDLKSLWEKVLP